MAVEFFVPLELIVVPIFVLLVAGALILGWLAITGRVGSRARREALTRHPLTTAQRILALVVVALYLSAALVASRLDLGMYSIVAYVPAVLLGVGVWAWWDSTKNDETA